LAAALGVQAELKGDGVLVTDPGALTDLLARPPHELPSPAQAAWLAWLVPWAHAVHIQAAGTGWTGGLQAAPPEVLPQDWLATEVEGLLEAAARGR
jgi:hypothetical protein